MSIKDKLEIGLKPDAPYRKANLPESQRDRAIDAPRKTSRARPASTRRTTTTSTRRRTRTKAR